MKHIISALLLGFATVLPAAAANVFIDAETEAEWALKGSNVWAALMAGNTIQFPDGVTTQTAVKVGCTNLMVSTTPAGMEIEAQRTPEYRNASGQVIARFTGSLIDPLDGQLMHSVGGAFIAQPPPFDHDPTLQPLGLKVMSTNSSIEKAQNTVFNRIGVRFNNTPSGRLLFLYEMSNVNEAGSRWYANDYTVPIVGAPWRPGRDFYVRTNAETHLRKLIVLKLAPYQDPTNTIPAKLTRSGLTIDYTASSLSDATAHINSYATDANLPTNRPYVIQLPAGVNQGGLTGGDWLGWCQKLNQLTGGRKVWLVGQPNTQIAFLNLQRCSNLGILFCRIGRTGVDSGTEAANEIYISGACKNLDLRNLWIECPDGVSASSIFLSGGGIDGLVFTDNILSGALCGIASQGSTVLRNSVIARNWFEQGYDAVQAYGGWYNVALAYNHFAGACGTPNREIANGHWGAALHTDLLQSQTNLSTQKVHKLAFFCNFTQYGRHNWPSRWYELGGGVQDVIVDGDAYENTHIYWNLFQNILPAGHRGVKTITPDYDYAMQQTGYATNNWIKNFTVLGNVFLDRWDHNNRLPYGYRRAQSSVNGQNIPDYFELLSGMNFQGGLAFDNPASWFSSYLEGRPDPVVMTGWKTNAPTLSGVYSNPITFTGSLTNGYQADFSQTTYATNKLLYGWCEPTDYAPAAGWETTPGSNPVAIPRSELQKIAPMPIDTGAFLGDTSRTNRYFEELTGTAFNASPLVSTNLWSAGTPDDGFLFHVKFGSVGTPGTQRELLRETEGTLQYTVSLTTNNTARYCVTSGETILSEVESVDTFSNGDHLTMQVFTPFYSVFAEMGYVSTVANRLYNEGIRKIRYWFSPAAPATNPTETAGVLNVWMNMSDHYRFYHFKDGAWKLNLTEVDGIHGCALRTFSTNRLFSFNISTNSAGVGTAENFRRDVYPVDTNEWRTLYLDGPAEDYSSEWANGDIRWTWDGDDEPVIMRNDNGTGVGSSSTFTLAGFSSGRPLCFIRHNIDHQDKAAGWVWTPNVDLPRGEVVLFSSFDGSCESVRIIRGGQGEYGLPTTVPAYRALETVGSAMSFIRPALNQQGLVSGWGTPDLYLHSGASGNAGRGGNVQAYTPPPPTNNYNNIISLNLTDNDGSGTMSATNLAGANSGVRVGNWNSMNTLNNSTLSGANAVYHNGSTVGGTFQAVYNTGRITYLSATSLTNDPLMFYAGNQLWNTNTSTLTLTGIPFTNYAIYVYSKGSGANRGGSVSIGSTTYYQRDSSSSVPAADGSGYIQMTTTAYNPTNPGAVTFGHYACFTNLSGTGQTISFAALNMGDANHRFWINGIQIVGTGTNIILPPPWLTADIGTGITAGSANESNGTYIVKGAGTIGNTADKYRFVYQILSGDGEIKARIPAFESGTEARIGVMMRDTLTAGSTEVVMGINGSGTYYSLCRANTGETASSTAAGSGTAPNVWVRLVRSGNTFTAYKSADGTNWAAANTNSVTMATDCYFGLCVSSGVTNLLNTSTFDALTVIP